MSLLYFFSRSAITFLISAISAADVAFANRRSNNSLSMRYCSSRRRFCSTNDAYSVKRASVCFAASALAFSSALSNDFALALSNSVPSPDNSLRLASITFSISSTVFALASDADNSLLNASSTVFLVSSAMASFSWRNCLFWAFVRLATSTSKMMSRWRFK